MIKRTTEIWKVDPNQPDPAIIAKAAAIIRSGGLVAFPTETVYGLGANALEAEAVAAIYAAKGRPANNPVIVHIAKTTDAAALVKEWPTTAQFLADRFWPGPLTMVLPRSERVSDIITAGGPTIAVRYPDHAVAQALIRAAGVPIAAPSANRSSELSPTRAEHVAKTLNGRIDVILDAGPTQAGIESTVIDLSGPLPRLLRPGPIPPSEIEAIVGHLLRLLPQDESAVLPSPGMLARHYAPRTPVRCCKSKTEVVERDIELTRNGRKTVVLWFGCKHADSDVALGVAMPDNPDRYAEDLYWVLHEMDRYGADQILVELPPDTDEWLAVRDRLKRASSTPGL